MGKTLILFAVLLAGCVARVPAEPVAPSGPPAAYPIAVEANAACVLGGFIYVFGGVAPELEKRCWRYDPRANTWDPLPDIPRARCFHVAAAASGRIYLIGGIMEKGSTGAEVDCYDPARRLWTSAAPMRSPRNRMAGVTVDGRIYVIGGMERREHLENTAVVDIYDPATDSWARGTNAPVDGHGHAMAVVGHEIVVAGGFGDLQSTYIYDTRADKWREGARMPEGRLFAGCAVVGGSVYVFGDRDHGDIPLLRYDFAADTWTMVAPTSVKTHRTAAVALNGLIYVIGGEDNVAYGLLDRVSRYDPAKGAWTHSDSP